jgi:hypothetical protein
MRQQFEVGLQGIESIVRPDDEKVDPCRRGCENAPVFDEPELEVDLDLQNLDEPVNDPPQAATEIGTETFSTLQLRRRSGSR